MERPWEADAVPYCEAPLEGGAAAPQKAYRMAARLPCRGAVLPTRADGRTTMPHPNGLMAVGGCGNEAGLRAEDG